MSEDDLDDFPLDGSLWGEGQPCFGCGPDHPIGFQLTFEKHGDRVRTLFTPGEQYQGPPGIMHGGLVMTLGDELASWSLIGLKRKFGFTGRVECAIRSAVRIGTEVVGEGFVANDRGRIVGIGVELRQGDTLCFTGTYRFVVLDEQGAERLLGQPLPESWKRFSR